MNPHACDVCGIRAQLETHPCGARVCPGCWDRCSEEMSDDSWDRWVLRQEWVEGEEYPDERI